MKALAPDDIRKLADIAESERSRRLLMSGYLWKFTDRLDEIAEDNGNNSIVSAGMIGAYVLDSRPEPYLTTWTDGGWNCECGAEHPCLHLAALLMELEKRRPGTSPISMPPRLSGREQPPSVDHRLDPVQDLLFFTEPNPVSKKTVVVLDRENKVSAALHQSKFVTGLHQAASDSGLCITDLTGAAWSLRNAEIVIREDGSRGALKPSPLPLAGVRPDTGAISPGAILGSLLSSLYPPENLQGIPWTRQIAGNLRVRFEPLLSSSDDEAVYEPVVEMRAGGTIRSGGLVFTGENLVFLDSRDAVSVILEHTADFLWFIRLILSRKVLSASDIRSRLSDKRGVPEEIEIVMPDLPETLSMLKPQLVLEVNSRGDVTDFHPKWRYGGVLVSPDNRSEVVMAAEGRGGRRQPAGLRDRAGEARLLKTAETILYNDLSWHRGLYSSLAGGQEMPLRLEKPLGTILEEHGNALMDSGMEIRLEDRPLRKGGAFGVRARSAGSVLELKAGVSGDESEEFSDLELDEWLQKSGLVRTRDAYFTLSEKALEQLAFLRSHGMENSGFLSTSPDNLSLIDAVYAQITASEETFAVLDRRKSIFRGLAEFSPEGCPDTTGDFQAVLRPYQKYGYAWLLHLKDRGLGACLADDMGLGKTVQTLAYLTRLKADGRLGPSLMVGPVVTLANWEAEIRRFAPALRFHRYSGPSEKRIIPGAASGVDLILVSYQTLRNDAEKFLDRVWNHIILDEAHYVKNAASRTFKVVRSLQAEQRISLTGTPLENHLNELWSQMTFLNPGLLGTPRQFNERFVRPVERKDDEGALGRLADIVAPFILRRRKQDVLHELPPRDEAIIRCDMTEDQAEAYQRMKDLYYRQVTGLLSDKGLEGSRIAIFSILSKLRLLAIHPPLAGSSFTGISSGKMTVLDNLLEEILEEEHKTLVFSQFLGALDRAEDTCRKHAWRFSRLTGSTRNREEPIRVFQEDPATRVFLLSLKAGGIGINLTAADYVILLDPWWNPAVEAQAVDRAHRIGQTRPVMAYRLISAGTIEENVLELQERKKNLVEGVLGDGGMPSLDEEEILKLFE